MSAIDTVDHVHVGFFCDVPIYWCIEPIERYELTGLNRDIGKYISKQHLVIGGGSGEHQALVLSIRSLLMYEMEYSLPPEYEDLSIDSWSYESCSALEEKISYYSGCFKETVLSSLANFVMREMPIEECCTDKTLLSFVRGNASNYCVYMDNIRGILNSNKLGKKNYDGKSHFGYSLHDYMSDKVDDSEIKS